jgi:hypothetical protein
MKEPGGLTAQMDRLYFPVIAFKIRRMTRQRDGALDKRAQLFRLR